MTDKKNEADQQEEPTEIAEASLLHDLMGVVLQEIKALPEVWQKLGEHEQDLIIDRVDRACRTASRSASRIIASGAREHAFARVDYVKFKEGEATAVLKGRADLHMHMIADAVAPVLLVLAADDRAGETHQHEADPDQAEIELPEGDDFVIPAPTDDPGEGDD